MPMTETYIKKSSVILASIKDSLTSAHSQLKVLQERSKEEQSDVSICEDKFDSVMRKLEIILYSTYLSIDSAVRIRDKGVEKI